MEPIVVVDPGRQQSISSHGAHELCAWWGWGVKGRENGRPGKRKSMPLRGLGGGRLD